MWVSFRYNDKEMINALTICIQPPFYYIQSFVLLQFCLVYLEHPAVYMEVIVGKSEIDKALILVNRSYVK